MLTKLRANYMLMLAIVLHFIAAKSFAQTTPADSNISGIKPVSIIKNLTDSALLDIVQRQTCRYFWDFGHPISGMARERSNTAYGYGAETVTTGGTGFGIMATIVADKRGWINHEQAIARVLKIVRFLAGADAYHGAFPHWLNGQTGKTIPFGPKDDGADLVETSYLFEGLLCARQYYKADTPRENELRALINTLWNNVEWDWFTRNGSDVLYWHWSPNNGWAMNFPIHGFNECLITYILAASAVRYPVPASVYHHGWANGNFFKNGKTFYGHILPLGFDYGGPLFFSQYTFMALNPTELKDDYANYWQQTVNHTLINYYYCVDNPKRFKGYGPNCWGLTASDDNEGYSAHSPTNDLGVISPTAAIAAFPYAPGYAMKALRHFYYQLGNKIWGQYGFTDAFNESKNWYAKSYLAIDQGPQVVMIENYRSGLIWNLFMSCPEVKAGLKKLNFQSSVYNLNRQ